jgi:16S rRNA (cytosine1402-N4)-methyltransferase
MIHIPVLQREVLQYLDPRPNENFVDCTIGHGGHALAILERNGPGGKILGIDWNEEMIKNLKGKERLILVCDNFANLKEIVRKQKFRRISGILFDLGVASWHLEESKRGFSFQRNEVLDMRYNLQNPLTAEKILNYWSKDEIEKILREFGEEKLSKKIAEKIVEARKMKPIRNTFQLTEIIKKVSSFGRQKIPRRRRFATLRGRHPATRTFQALRIAVNGELDNLQKVLPQTLEILEKSGRLAIISFHSLEDRIVKNFFRQETQNNSLKVLTKKPITPSFEEIKINPRSRSAKLRAIVKTA